ncbi:uncharacterized protein (DUF2249 family)/quercetin dioxygenase-like cupin family protein [Streptosporangium becharense]|uniref:Uncharacterized protein (DUF2249 family) n=1 Tax=Streptosporangium becharense TaxID=1816182 RepID=A0A7W9IB78_9ACTN|nr:DUF2249 domain-containing protein [Streptosporangium becharense]MBB2910645.1 uncharacterized protein (DUF2249 family)/quercetin dioxygenase-like cupin family protein [Streptosporangium becharense]MBB5817340.1 uncharacterized protein (DUF2249 family) [Streptosporangium becharense]
MSDQELDVRSLRKPDKHPTIFATYGALAVGESFVLVNDHDPRHLRDEFENEHPGGHGWDYLDRGPGVWRIRITKLAATPLPRLLCDTGAVPPDATGTAWKLEVPQRDLDADITRLAPEATVDAHNGLDHDVLLHVLHGTGRLTTERGTLDLRPGALVWLPRRSRRRLAAGPEGLGYLTVHRGRQALVLEPVVRTPEPADR